VSEQSLKYQIATSVCLLFRFLWCFTKGLLYNTNSSETCLRPKCTSRETCYLIIDYLSVRST